MSLRVIRAIGQAERADEIHLARLLFLLDSAPVKQGAKAVDGIMKLAKLDFLLRYPNCFERVLQERKVAASTVHIHEYERASIEAKMVRFRYGPWDSRYRRWIALLVARGLANTYLQGRTVRVLATAPGHQAAEDLAASAPELAELAERSRLVQRAVGRMSATSLKEFIYETFPEILDMRWGEEIEL
jgi:hypothetical protein